MQINWCYEELPNLTCICGERQEDTVDWTNAIWKLQRKYMSRSKKERKIMTYGICWNDWGM